MLARYIQTDEVFKCPAQERAWQNSNFHGLIAPHFGTNSGSQTHWGYGPKRLSQIARLPEIVSFADGIGDGSGDSEYTSLSPWGWNSVDGASLWSNPVACRGVLPPACADFHFQGLTADPPFWPSRLDPVFPQRYSLVARHNGRINCAFLDSHVKAMDLAILATANVTGGYGVGWRYFEVTGMYGWGG